MAPGKAGARTPELARVLFARNELAGDGRGLNCTGDSDGGLTNWRFEILFHYLPLSLFIIHISFFTINIPEQLLRL